MNAIGDLEITSEKYRRAHCHICEKERIPFLQWLIGKRVCGNCEYLEWQAQLDLGLIPQGDLSKGRLVHIYFRSPKDMEKFITEVKNNPNIKAKEMGFLP